MKGRLLTLRNILFAIGAVFQTVLYFLLLRQTFSDPAYLKQVDYIAIYTGGYIAHYESLLQLYDLDLQRQVQAWITAPLQLNRFYPFNHPPLLASFLQLTTTTDYTASYIRWILVLAFIHLVALLTLNLLSRSADWQKGELWILGISGLLFFPAFSAYLKGQDSVFLLLAVSLWVLGLLTGRERVSGLGLALTAIRPQVMLVLAIPFFFKQRRIWWWFVLFGLVLLIYSFLLVGLEGFQDLIQILLFSGQGAGFDLVYMTTLMGALTRLYPNLRPQTLHLIGYGGYALAIFFLCLVWIKSWVIEYKQVGLAIILYMVFSPHMHSHDLILLIIPAMGAAIAIARNESSSEKYAALLPMCVSLILLVNQFLGVYFIVYLLFLVLALLLWFPGWFTRPFFRKVKEAS